MAKATDDYSLKDIIFLVCAKTQMFVGNRDFRTAATFIDGFTFGRGGTEGEDMNQFCHWLQTECYQRFNYPRNWAWSCYVTWMFPDDEDALKALPNLWLLYKSGTTLKNVRRSSLLKQVPLPNVNHQVE